MFNHRLTHTESPETQNMIGLTYFDHEHPIICKIYVRGPYGEIMWFEIVFLIDLTWFWQSKMLNYIFFRGKIKFGDRRYNPFTPIMSICIWSGSREFNRTDCNMLFRPFWTLKSIYGTSEYVLDIPAHLIITPDCLNTSNSEYSSPGHHHLA